jgi:Ferritin-like domain
MRRSLPRDTSADRAARAVAGRQADAVEALELAYTLESLQYFFYHSALTAAVFGGARDQLAAQPAAAAALATVRDHEAAHVELLRAMVAGAGGSAPAYTASSFDFTGSKGAGGGPFAAVATDGRVLLAVAQLFEDLGVRAYAGQLAAVAANKAVLTAAMQILSVEARHAAKVRRLRLLVTPSLDVDPWISGSASGIPGLIGPGSAIAAAVYDGEGVTTQAGVAVASLAADVGPDAATSAFDEPLPAEAVKRVVSSFVVGGL